MKRLRATAVAASAQAAAALATARSCRGPPHRASCSLATSAGGRPRGRLQAALQFLRFKAATLRAASTLLADRSSSGCLCAQ